MATLGFLTQYLPSFSGSFITVMLWGVILIGGSTILIVILRNKLKYKYYGICFRRRQESFEGIPQSAMVSGKAGYFKTKAGKTIFRIKYGLMPWMKIETSQLPDPKHITGNTVIFLQVQKDNYTQARIKIDWEGNTFKLEPIDDSLKYDAMLELSEIDRVLENKKLSPVTVGMMVIGLIIIAGIIVFYFLGKAG